MATTEEQQISYRAMSAEDLSSVLEIETRAYAFPWSAGIFKDCLSAGYDCRLLCLGSQVVGHAVLSAAAGEAHLLNICIQRELQGQGLGRVFVRHILRRAELLGAGRIFLEVRPSNKKAIRLYESMGFMQIGVRRDYYPGDPAKEDALVLALQLEPVEA